MMHHHYWNDADKETVCVECNNSSDYCLEDHITVSQAVGLEMDHKLNNR